MKSLLKIFIYLFLLAFVCFSVFVVFYDIPTENTTVTKEIKHEINE